MPATPDFLVGIRLRKTNGWSHEPDGFKKYYREISNRHAMMGEQSVSR